MCMAVRENKIFCKNRAKGHLGEFFLCSEAGQREAALEIRFMDMKEAL